MKQFIIVIVAIFIALSITFYALKIYVPDLHFVALMSGNIIMATLTLSSYFIIRKQMNDNIQAFVRGVSGASFMKLMVCMVSLLLYVLLDRAHIHKPTVFILFGIYAAYTIPETVLLSKIVRK